MDFQVNVRIPFEQKELDSVFTVPADVSTEGDLHFKQLVVNILKKYSLSLYVYMFPGRSMGARSAVAVCKRICDRQKDAVQGVLCLSFPLNLPGKPQTNVERSHDNMCEQNLLQSIMHVMKSTSAVHWVKDANHGLTVRGRTEESVLEEVSC
uniref:KANL3/Tex30 alpha/beta hydrolase-like domain-containing protein n=1 Tax=Sinocyclocheilus grahami TaxID=75366 RepID=A0A672KY45_SINGR